MNYFDIALYFYEMDSTFSYQRLISLCYISQKVLDSIVQVSYNRVMRNDIPTDKDLCDYLTHYPMIEGMGFEVRGTCYPLSPVVIKRLKWVWDNFSMYDEHTLKQIIELFYQIEQVTKRTLD